ncbi:MAG TPA: MFS transporter [Steroidobacteraceae bacterium]|nr:MFS transporter [Steroidobacteraceae bacterium]
MPLVRSRIRIRWWIFAYMFGFAMLSYMQRQSIAVAAENIMPALHLSQMQIGWINASFTAAYAIAQLPGGVLGQRFGARIVFVGIGVVGLIATLATPLAPVVLAGNALFLALLIAQGTLGLSQGPLFPVFAAVLQEWFPAHRWAMANGLQTAGMLLGGAVTPLFIVVLTDSFGWQGALLWVGLPVALLTAGWAWYGRDRPRDHPKVTAAELAEVDGGGNAVSAPLTLRRLLGIMGDRDVLLLAFSYLSMNYAFYLISFWSFLYLVQVRHFSGLESGLVGAAPWVGAGIGAAIGGYVSDWLAGRLGVRWGYRLVPLVTLPIAGVLLLVTITVTTPYAAVVALACAFCAVEVNEGAYWAATMCVARKDTAAATGVLNTGGNLGGVITQPIVGALSGAGAWSAAFATGTVFALIAAGTWLLVDPDRRASANVAPPPASGG